MEEQNTITELRDCFRLINRKLSGVNKENLVIINI